MLPTGTGLIPLNNRSPPRPVTALPLDSLFIGLGHSPPIPLELNLRSGFSNRMAASRCAPQSCTPACSTRPAFLESRPAIPRIQVSGSVFVDRHPALPAHALEECHTEHSKCLRVSYVLHCYRIPPIHLLKLGYEWYFTSGARASYRHEDPYKARHFEGAPDGYVGGRPHTIMQ